MSCEKCHSNEVKHYAHLVIAEETSNYTYTRANYSVNRKNYRMVEKVIVTYCTSCFIKYAVRKFFLGIALGFVSVLFLLAPSYDVRFNIEIPFPLNIVCYLLGIFIGTMSFGIFIQSLTESDFCTGILSSQGKMTSIFNYEMHVFTSKDWDNMQKTFEIK